MLSLQRQTHFSSVTTSNAFRAPVSKTQAKHVCKNWAVMYAVPCTILIAHGETNSRGFEQNLSSRLLQVLNLVRVHSTGQHSAGNAAAHGANTNIWG
eukprot:141035-Chlamydomonas_euryale.AAC.12